MTLGSCLLTLLFSCGFPAFAGKSNGRADPAAVITGIGFSGEGTIMNTGKSSIGPTAASSSEAAAAIVSKRQTVPSPLDKIKHPGGACAVSSV